MRPSLFFVLPLLVLTAATKVSNFAAASGDDSQRNTVYEFEKKFFALLEARRPTSEVSR